MVRFFGTMLCFWCSVKSHSQSSIGWSAFVVIKVLSVSPSHHVGWSTFWPNESMMCFFDCRTAKCTSYTHSLVGRSAFLSPLLCWCFRNLLMIILLIIYMSDGPTSADLSNTEESRRRPTSAGLSNIEESKRRLGYQLHKIGYTLCDTSW